MKKTSGMVLIVLTALALLSGPAGAAVIYIVDAGCNQCGDRSAKITTIDSASAVEQMINSGTGHNLTDVAITPSGQRLYAIGNTTSNTRYLYRYDPVTGAQLDRWNLGTSNFRNALLGESETSLLMMAADSSKIWRVNLDGSGDYLSTTLLGYTGFTSGGDLAFGLDGTLYGVGNPQHGQGPNSKLYSIDLDGGVSSTYIGDMGHTNFYGLAIDEQGILYAGRGEPSNGEKIYTVNTATGATSFFYNTNLPCGIYGMASSITSNVPEPATLGFLLLSGLALLGYRRQV